MSEPQKITDLLRAKYGFSTIHKNIKITANDTLYTIYRKTAKFIYDNRAALPGGIKPEEERTAILQQRNAWKINKIRKVPQGAFFNKELNEIGDYYGFSNRGSDNWLNHIYQLDMEYNWALSKGAYKEKPKIEKKTAFVFVDPNNSHRKNNDNEAHWNNNIGKDQWLTKGKSWWVYNQAPLIGYAVLRKDAMKRIPTVNKIEKQQLSRLLDQLECNMSPKRARESRVFQTDPLVEAAWIGSKPDPENDKQMIFEPKKGIKSYWDKKGLLEQHERNLVLTKLNHYLFDTYNLSLQQAYNQQLEHHQRATFYEQKKNIRPEAQRAMLRLSSSLPELAGVEVDNDVDTDKLKKLEPEIEATLKVLPLNKQKPYLRFRKLGNYHLLGAYVPFNHTLAVDFRKFDGNQVGIQSFIHEYGHYLDHTSGNLSLSPYFRSVLKQVQKKIGSEKISRKQKNYLTIPTEVFARAFEIYASNAGVNNSLIKSPEAYHNQKDIRYSCFNDQSRMRINYLFDSWFPGLREKLSRLNLQEPQTDLRKSTAKYIHNYNLGLSTSEEAFNKLDQIRMESSKKDNPEYNPLKAISVSWVDNYDSHIRSIGIYPVKPEKQGAKPETEYRLSVTDLDGKEAFQSLAPKIDQELTASDPGYRDIRFNHHTLTIRTAKPAFTYLALMGYASNSNKLMKPAKQPLWSRISTKLTQAYQKKGVAISSRFVNKKAYQKAKTKDKEEDKDFKGLLDQQQQMSNQLNLF